MKKDKTADATTGNGVSRRKFIQITGVTALAAPYAGFAAGKAGAISIVADPSDKLVTAGPVQWALTQLENSLAAKSVTVKKFERLADAPAGDLCIVIAHTAHDNAKTAAAKVPAEPEALGLIPAKLAGKNVLLATANDARGLVYAILELKDRVEYSTQPLVDLNIKKAIIEKPANSIRSLTRLFVSDVEDKPWYNDREMWPKYLDMLATQRFNRFNLSFGIGYDFIRNVTDGYMVFTYPFLLAVPGYNVRVPQLPDTERDENLRLLQFISEETVKRGMQFQLGLWMHGYEWINSPNPNYTIEGVNAQNHGPYCRDAVRALLKACPAVSGVTFRVHGESGVNEGSYDFWRTVFSGVATCGREVEIDMHAKGMDQTMVDSAVATKLPIVISPKYWAEHLGMPYHQADIRKLEVPNPEKKTSVLMNLSEGSRSFIRYGYGDLLREDRPFKVLHRIWPGTQRLLLSGDPLTAAAHARAFSFCGSAGVELMEPLSFKGRRGSGIAGDRCGYADASYKPKWDWEKYLYTLRVFGRHAYNPDTDPDVWQRLLRKQFGAGSSAVEAALANASRILPIILTAHGASAGNNTYWPEVYTNQPMVNPEKNNHYSDTPAPKSFGNVSPMDPQLFHGINDYASVLVKGAPDGKYSPIQVAQWLEDYAATAETSLNKAATLCQNKSDADYKRMSLDVKLQVGLGRFFADKFRAGVLYAIFEQTGDRVALEEALRKYRQGREQWVSIVDLSKDVYKKDITVGERPFLRGHWSDRLAAIDTDISDMSKKLEATTATANRTATTIAAVKSALAKPTVPGKFYRHTAPASFSTGQAIDLSITADRMPASAQLFYRHVNQAERYESVPMELAGKNYRARIPAAYTKSNYPIEYYFEVKEHGGGACIFPGFNRDQVGQPYFVVRSV